MIYGKFSIEKSFPFYFGEKIFDPPEKSVFWSKISRTISCEVVNGRHRVL